MDFLSTLNQQQREAVTHTEGPLLILAGAGSGKTRVITYRIAYLIAEHNVAPYNILAVTFTNKAAGEMRERVEKLLRGIELRNAPLVSTFHSLCVRILRQDIEHLREGFTRSFTIYDQDDAVKLVKGSIKDLGFDEKQLSPRITQGAISGAKNRGDDPQSYSAKVEGHDERRIAIAQVFKLYQERLANNNALDFDDLLIKTVQLLRRAQEVREKYNDKFKYILIDEYQDTNPLQLALIKFLTQKQQNICVVGDPDQCLPNGTKVLTPKGYKSIEHIKEGEEVISASGHSRTLPSKVTKVKTKNYKGKIVKIKTLLGKTLSATPNHILFGKVNPLPNKHLVYLMYRQDKGYRIGRSIGMRSYDKNYTNAIGIQVRCNQEHADKMWVLRICDSKPEATFYEALYSSLYGIPTMVFHLIGRNEGMSFTQDYIDRLYNEVDTRSRVLKIFEDFDLFSAYPHFRPKTRFEANRFMLNLVMFGNNRITQKAPWGRHSLQFGTSEKSLRPLFESAGLPCHDGKKHTWRMETARINFADAYSTAEHILQIDKRIDLKRKALLVADKKAFSEFPASHFHAGMSIAVYHKGEIFEDEVTDISLKEFNGSVYDLDIADTHNFIAQEFVAHNSIYKFRAADIRNILEFENEFPNARTILLEQNYRSTQTILDAADAVVSNNIERKKKKLWTTNSGGEKIRYYQATDSDGEARFTAAKIQEHFRVEPGIRAAVLYRTNSQSRIFEEMFRRSRIDYNIVGGFSFYERAEVKDIIAYLKLAINPHDSIALLRVVNTPPRGLGKQTLEDLYSKAKDFGVSMWEAISIVTAQDEGFSPRAVNSFKGFKKVIEDLSKKVGDISKPDSPVSDVVKAAIFDSGYEKMLRSDNSEESDARLANLEELVNAAVDYDAQEQNGLRDFIDHSALVSDTDQYKSDARVTLMTMHAAKGLEFPLVFIVGLEDGLFPHARSINDPQELEEERRLCYVAITRAEKYLYITHAMRRRVYGDEIAAEPSQFLNEMPLDLIQDLSHGSSWLGSTSRRDESDRIVRALRGENDRPQRTTYTGKTYNSTEAIAEFFKQRKEQQKSQPTEPLQPQKEPPLIQRLRDRGIEESKPIKQTSSAKTNEGITTGDRVRHAKYGVGLVLRREGTGDSTKLTVSFPGFGQKKMIEKFAGLTKI